MRKCPLHLLPLSAFVLACVVLIGFGSGLRTVRLDAGFSPRTAAAAAPKRSHGPPQRDQSADAKQWAPASPRSVLAEFFLGKTSVPQAGVLAMPGSGARCPCPACSGHVPAEFVLQSAWPETGGEVVITYSYSNLLDGTLPLPAETLRAAVQEAMGLWAGQTAIRFVEIADSGPLPDDRDTDYAIANHAHIRIGHHRFDGDSGVLAHTFFPPPNGNGLAGDIHFDNEEKWTVDPNSGIDFIEVCLHELGHALGLDHEPSPPDGQNAIMNPFYGSRFSGLGTAFLLADDIAGVRCLYEGDCGGSANITAGLCGSFFALVAAQIDVHETTASLNALRRFRDDVLMPTASGRQWVARYYRHSEEVVQLFQKDPRLAAESGRLLHSLTLSLSQHEATQPAVLLERRLIKECLLLLARMAPAASEELQATIKQLAAKLRSAQPVAPGHLVLVDF